MTTGHLNPGYNQVVSQCKTAISNPSGKNVRQKFNLDELEQIKAHSKSVWSTKDTSETTYGWYHGDPLIKEQPNVRPSSPTRRNNPHPHLYGNTYFY